MAPTKNPLIAVKSVPGRFEPFAKAGRAEHFIIMLGDTLPAEESAALRTAGHCLAKHMIQTTLVSEVRHLSLFVYYSCKYFVVLIEVENRILQLNPKIEIRNKHE